MKIKFKLKHIFVALFLFCMFGAIYCHFNLQTKQNFVVMADDSIILDEQLERYLMELNNEQLLSSTSFSHLTELTFDGASSSVCNGITTIYGLSQFVFEKLETITFKNMTKLESIDLSGVGYHNKLKLDNLSKLENLNYNNNLNLKEIEISNCSNLKFEIDSNTAKKIATLKLNNLNAGQISIPSQMQNLTYLEINNSNALTNLDLSASSLKKLILNGNQFLLTLKIDASQLNDLTLKNNQRLQTLDLSRSPNLKNIDLDEMTFEENGFVVARTILYAPSLKNIFISANDWIESFDISRSKNIETIVFNGCTNLKTIDLADDLQKLQTLDLTNCYNMANINFNSALNMQSLSLKGCNLLGNNAFANISQMKNLQYLNLNSTNLRELVLNDFENLQILLLGSNYLSKIDLMDVPNLYKLDIENSSNLNNIKIVNAISLEKLSLGNCSGIRDLTLENVALTLFSVAGKSMLNKVVINSSTLQELKIYDCENLSTLDFSQCQELKDIEILGCASLNSETIDNFQNLNNIETIYISECSSIYTFNLEDKPTIKELNLKNLNNLTILNLKNLGTNSKITLPQNTFSLRSLSLQGFKYADFGTTTLDLSNGVLSSVTLVNVPFETINLNDNVITVFNISGVDKLRFINLSNNRITNAESVMSLLDSAYLIELLDINNNRIDFSKGKTLKKIQSGIYFYSISIGVQNIIADNDYTFKPKIYFGGFGPHHQEIKAVIYHSTKKYAKASLSQSVLNTFSKSNLREDKFKKYSNGTYYITFEKVDSNGNVIAMTDEEKAMFMPIYFTVSTEFDFVRFIWIIFIGVAVLIFIYVGVSWFFEKRRKARLLGEDTEDGIGLLIDESMSKKEIKMLKKEHKKQSKENAKLQKIEEKNQYILDKENYKNQKALEKEQKIQNEESAKLAKIAEKERLKQEKEQAKLDKERDKLLKKQEKEENKLKELVVKTKLSKEDKKAKRETKDLVKEPKIKEEKTKKEKEKQEVLKDNSKIQDKLEKKRLKEEQKELMRLEKENLREEKLREKAEAKGEKFVSKKKNDEEDDFDFFAKKENIESNDEDFEDALSDKDLENIISESKSKAQPPKMPPKKPPFPPRMPKK